MPNAFLLAMARKGSEAGTSRSSEADGEFVEVSPEPGASPAIACRMNSIVEAVKATINDLPVSHRSILPLSKHQVDLETESQHWQETNGPPNPAEFLVNPPDSGRTPNPR